MTGRLDGIAKLAIGMAVSLLGAGVAAGQPTSPGGDLTRPPGPPAHEMTAAVGAPTTRPAEARWPLAAAAPEEAPTTWSGRSVVRRHDPPDHYVRPPDQPYRAFALAATGDLLIHTPVWTRAALPGGGYDFGPQLAAAHPDVAGADLGLCHLEVPLDPDGPYSSYPRFNAPAELADGIAATGWDVCSTASNHSADQGFEGLVNTLSALESAGVAHRGMFRSEEERRATPLIDVEGVAVGVLSATYGLNGLPQPGGHPWAVRLIDAASILDDVRALRAAGAEVVVVSLHWGEEYQHEPTAFQRQVAAQLMTGGEVDAIIGHHAHVVQPVEWIGGRPVVYGLGNFLSGQRPTERRDGTIVTLEFVEDRDGWHVEALHAQPTWVDDRYAVVTADPDQGGVLGASAQRTLGHLGVPLSPPPPAPATDPTHYVR